MSAFDIVLIVVGSVAGWFAHSEYLRRKAKKPGADTQGGGGGGPIEPK